MGLLDVLSSVLVRTGQNPQPHGTRVSTVDPRVTPPPPPPGTLLPSSAASPHSTMSSAPSSSSSSTLSTVPKPLTSSNCPVLPELVAPMTPVPRARTSPQRSTGILIKGSHAGRRPSTSSKVAESALLRTPHGMNLRNSPGGAPLKMGAPHSGGKVSSASPYNLRPVSARSTPQPQTPLKAHQSVRSSSSMPATRQVVDVFGSAAARIPGMKKHQAGRTRSHRKALLSVGKSVDRDRTHGPEPDGPHRTMPKTSKANIKRKKGARSNVLDRATHKGTLLASAGQLGSASSNMRSRLAGTILFQRVSKASSPHQIDSKATPAASPPRPALPPSSRGQRHPPRWPSTPLPIRQSQLPSLINSPLSSVCGRDPDELDVDSNDEFAPAPVISHAPQRVRRMSNEIRTIRPMPLLTHRLNRPKRVPVKSLDHKYYPMLVDNIMCFSTRPTLLKLRMVSKAFRVRANRLLGEHLVFKPDHVLDSIEGRHPALREAHVLPDYCNTWGPIRRNRWQEDRAKRDQLSKSMRMRASVRDLVRQARVIDLKYASGTSLALLRRDILRDVRVPVLRQWMWCSHPNEGHLPLACDTLVNFGWCRAWEPVGGFRREMWETPPYGVRKVVFNLSATYTKVPFTFHGMFTRRRPPASVEEVVFIFHNKSHDATQAALENLRNFLPRLIKLAFEAKMTSNGPYFTFVNADSFHESTFPIDAPVGRLVDQEDCEAALAFEDYAAAAFKTTWESWREWVVFLTLDEYEARVGTEQFRVETLG